MINRERVFPTRVWINTGYPQTATPDQLAGNPGSELREDQSLVMERISPLLDEVHSTNQVAKVWLNPEHSGQVVISTYYMSHADKSVKKGERQGVWQVAEFQGKDPVGSTRIARDGSTAGAAYKFTVQDQESGKFRLAKPEEIDKCIDLFTYVADQRDIALAQAEAVRVASRSASRSSRIATAVSGLLRRAA
jgi:hypothetical protein